MKASLEEMTEEERAKKVGVKKILGIYDEVEYFMPRLKEFIQ
ncbi:hypothetical protein GCM10023189_36360 [Nibrella saemangeumensis]|uniref:Uncharacterized protein n=2 Tax=Nibrella saemangeumensis TaxID=1084526 RepID=A0ABP8N7Q3_9BACT